MTTPLPPDEGVPPGYVPPPEEAGGDPWLPARLAALAFLLAGEAAVFQAYLDMLNGWFAAIRPRIYRGGVVDPLAVYSAPEEFKRGLGRFLGSVRTVLHESQERVLGPDRLAEFDTLRFTVDYLASVENRMVATPDEVFDLVRSEVERGALEGLSIPEIAEEIDSVLLETSTGRWQNRATTVARTETVGAYNGGTEDAFQWLAEVDPELEMEKVWLATIDPRTRDTHFAADGQRVPLWSPFIVGGFPGMHPGDKALPAQESINCRCTALYVEPGDSVDLAGRGWRAAKDEAREVRARAKRQVYRARDGRAA